MEPLDFTRSKALNNIPNKKIQDELNAINSSNDAPNVKYIKSVAINRYAVSNIPVEYWYLKMDKDFVGDERLKITYDDYVKDIDKSYTSGSSLCLAGTHGVGKSFVSTCILKKVCQKNYSALYTDLSSIVSVLTQGSAEEKFIARRELTMVDFLVIDEIDPRFSGSDNAADLYARQLEIILRSRSSNKLPTIICTNSPNVVESFNGSLKASLDSLMKGYIKSISIFNDDFRKRINK